MCAPQVTATFHLITGEYPPSSGGVGDYTQLIAGALADRGCAVHVWCPHVETAGVDGAGIPGSGGSVTLHRLPDVFGRASRTALERALEQNPGRMVLQYVPNALGLRGGNLPFCLWVRALGRHTDVRVMFHEPYFYLRWRNPLRSGLALLQRVMAAALLRSASSVYVSTSAWRRYLSHLAPAGTAFIEMPIPSTIPGDPAATDVQRYRARFTREGAVARVLGHFGTYGDHVAAELRRAIPALLQRMPDLSVICIGRGSEAFAGEFGTPRVVGTGALKSRDVAAAIGACDLMLQPYPDGVTTRRTSVMAALAVGTATVTTSGFLTEPVWRETAAVALAPASDGDAIAGTAAALLGDDAARAALGAKGRCLYDRRFALACTIDRLLEPAGAGAR